MNSLTQPKGILFGLITLLVQYVGLFMLGFHSGLLLGLVGLCVADQVGADAARPESPWTAVGVLIVSGLALALLNLCCQVSSESNLDFMFQMLP